MKGRRYAFQSLDPRVNTKMYGLVLRSSYYRTR